METYICFLIITQLSLLTLIIMITKNQVLPKMTKTGCIVASALIMICDAAEFTGILLDGSNVIFIPLHAFVKYIELCLAPVIPIAFATAYYTIGSKKIVIIPNIIHIGLETLSLFFGYIFYIDGQNIYHHGKLYWIYYLFVFLSIAYFFHTIIRYGARFQNRNNLSLLMIFIFILVGVICQIIDPTVKIVWLTIAIAMSLFYIYYCNMVYQVDVLTKLLSRRSYETYKSSLKKKAYILLFDVNNFKSINDRFGHNIGDACLKCVASLIMDVYGKKGLCYRIGGDEFCVIIDRKVHSCNVEKLNAKFEKLLLERNCNNVAVPSVAVGYAIFDPEKTKISDATRKADEQMYLNKSIKKQDD